MDIVAQAALQRVEQVNHALNAIVEHRPDEVLAQARAIDAVIARGEDPGPLAGVPVTTKVNIDQAGYAATNGLRSQQNPRSPVPGGRRRDRGPRRVAGADRPAAGKRSELTLIDDAGHWVQYERPPAFEAALRRRLDA